MVRVLQAILVQPTDETTLPSDGFHTVMQVPMDMCYCTKNSP